MRGDKLTDYIERKDAIKRIESEYRKWGDDYDAEQILGDIEDIPSADVVERKRGEWVQISPAKIYECSVCGGNVMTTDIECYKYCHQCGALMKEKEDEYEIYVEQRLADMRGKE